MSDALAPFVLGLDPSFVSFAISDGHTHITVRTSPKCDYMERSDEIVNAIEQFVNDHGRRAYGRPVWVIEGPAYVGRESAMWDHGVITARVALLARARHVELLSVNPGKLKTFICGRGNAPKSEVALEILERWGVRFQDDRGADKAHAFALHKYGLAYLDGSLEHVPAKKRGRAKKLPPLRFQDVPADAYAWLCGGGAAQTLEVPGRAPLTLDKIPAAWRKRAARVLQAGMA